VIFVPDLELGPDFFRIRFFDRRSEHGLNQRHEIQGIVRPGDKIVRVAVKDDQEVAEACDTGEKKHRDPPEIVIGLYLAADIVAILLRAGGIADEEVGFSGMKGLEQFRSVGKKGNSVSLRRQLIADLLRGPGFFAENEDIDGAVPVRDVRICT